MAGGTDENVCRGGESMSEGVKKEEGGVEEGESLVAQYHADYGECQSLHKRQAKAKERTWPP